MSAEMNADVVSTVEKAIVESKNYETVDQIWDYLKTQMTRSAFDGAISQLKLAGKIMFNGPSIIYTGIDNANLKGLVDSSTPF
jgi:hypothetical protein